MNRSLLVVVAIVAAASLAVGPGAASATNRAGAATVGTAKSSLGRILVDRQGRTLYVFERDTRGRSACSGACAAYWPPLLTKGKPASRGAARRSLLGVTRRGDGTTQVTYAGHPLYRFFQDGKPGETNGQGLELSGGEWYVLSPVGRQIEKAAR